ncbi:MAG: hypothetical protein KJ956_14060 [Actinobacteria bacterium]|nr:hypothetical protein [Actinomycetota bacterium]
MGVRPIPTRHVTADSPAPLKPRRPTVVLGTFKGGCLKTAFAVAVAERLAWAELQVLLLTSDAQHDARFRLGVSPSDPQTARVVRREGGVTVRGVHPSKAVELLYGSGPGELKEFQVVVVDTAPVEAAGALPGVLLVAPVDGADAARNLVSLLRGTPENTEVMLVKYHHLDKKSWAKAAKAIADASKVEGLLFLPDPVPPARPIRDAHDDGVSVWDLPRRGNTKLFLDAVETIAEHAWQRVCPDKAFPAMPRRRVADAYVQGWSDDEDA